MRACAFSCHAPFDAENPGDSSLVPAARPDPITQGAADGQQRGIGIAIAAAPRRKIGR